MVNISNKHDDYLHGSTIMGKWSFTLLSLSMSLGVFALWVYEVYDQSSSFLSLIISVELILKEVTAWILINIWCVSAS